MNLEDLIKLAGVTKSPYDTPVQEQPTEIEEQPVMDDAEGMRTLIALVTPEQLNQLQGQAPVEEEGFANSGDEYAGEPEEYKGTLGSPADLSLRRYLGANGEHVTVDESKVYEDHKVEDITEAWKAYKLEERPSDLANILQNFRRGPVGASPIATTGPDGNPTGPGDRGFKPGKQTPPASLQNKRGFDPMGDQVPPASLQNKRGFDPMGDQVPPMPGEEPRLQNKRGFTPGEQEPEDRLKNQRGFTPGDDELDIGADAGNDDELDAVGMDIPSAGEPFGEPIPNPNQGSGKDADGIPIIGPGAGDPVGEPVPEPREPKPEEPAIIDPSAGDPENPARGAGKVPGTEPESAKDVEAKPVKGDRAGAVTKQMRKDAERYADEVGLPIDQIGTLVRGTVGGIATTLEVDANGTVTDMKTGDIIGGDDAEAARKAAGVKSESLQRMEYLAGLNESYVMERPSDRSRRGTRPPDAIGPGILQPKVGEPVPEPREPKPAEPAIIDPSAGDPVMPGISSADLDGDMPAEPSQPMPGIDPEDLDGDMPADPDTPDMGKDVFGRDKAALAKADAMFKKYGLTPPRSALMQSEDEETNEANAFIKAKIDAEKAGKDEFEVGGKKFKVEDVNQYIAQESAKNESLDSLRKLAGI